MFACAFLGGCATSSQPKDITPPEAVIAAAAKPITGTFLMEVRAAGRRPGRLFLNSELDYRDQRNLTIAMSDDIAQKWADRLGDDPASAMIGKKIRVTGTAERVTIWIYSGGNRPGDYYYQTHVRISDLSQIKVLGTKEPK